jgi:hypothetical protein
MKFELYTKEFRKKTDEISPKLINFSTYNFMFLGNLAEHNKFRLQALNN